MPGPIETPPLMVPRLLMVKVPPPRSTMALGTPVAVMTAPAELLTLAMPAAAALRWMATTPVPVIVPLLVCRLVSMRMAGVPPPDAAIVPLLVIAPELFQIAPSPLVTLMPAPELTVTLIAPPLPTRLVNGLGALVLQVVALPSVTQLASASPDTSSALPAATANPIAPSDTDRLRAPLRINRPPATRITFKVY